MAEACHYNSLRHSRGKLRHMHRLLITPKALLYGYEIAATKKPPQRSLTKTPSHRFLSWIAYSLVATLKLEHAKFSNKLSKINILNNTHTHTHICNYVYL